MPAGLFTYGGLRQRPPDGGQGKPAGGGRDRGPGGALRYRHIYRPDGLGGLYLARQETWTLEGEDYVLTAAEDFRQEGASSRPLTEGELQALAAWFNLWSDYPENNGLLRFPYDSHNAVGNYLSLLFYDMGKHGLGGPGGGGAGDPGGGKEAPGVDGLEQVPSGGGNCLPL